MHVRTHWCLQGVACLALVVAGVVAALAASHPLYPLYPRFPFSRTLSSSPSSPSSRSRMGVADDDDSIRRRCLGWHLSKGRWLVGARACDRSPHAVAGCNDYLRPAAASVDPAALRRLRALRARDPAAQRSTRAWEFEVHIRQRCTLRRVDRTALAATTMLHGKHVAVVGDSVARYLYAALLRAAAEDPHGWNMTGGTKHRDWEHRLVGGGRASFTWAPYAWNITRVLRTWAAEADAAAEVARGTAAADEYAAGANPPVAPVAPRGGGEGAVAAGTGDALSDGPSASSGGDAARVAAVVTGRAGQRLPDVLIMGSSLWHMLHVGSIAEYQRALGGLVEALTSPPWSHALDLGMEGEGGARAGARDRGREGAREREREEGGARGQGKAHVGGYTTDKQSGEKVQGYTRGYTHTTGNQSGEKEEEEKAGAGARARGGEQERRGRGGEERRNIAAANRNTTRWPPRTVAFWLTTSAVRPEKFTAARKIEMMTPAMVNRFNGGARRSGLLPPLRADSRNSRNFRNSRRSGSSSPPPADDSPEQSSPCVPVDMESLTRG